MYLSAYARRVLLWINNVDDPMTAGYRAIMCSFLAHGLSVYHLPTLDARRVYQPGTYIILLTKGSDLFEAAIGR
jgi:hypothetical protein